MIGIVNKFENIDPEELPNRLQAKKVNEKYMADKDLDDLCGKVFSAVKKHWEQKYIMSKEELKVFSQQLKFKQSMSTPSSQHKIGYIQFHLPNRK